MTEKDVTPTTPEDAEMQKVYQEYLQKCCEAGQLRYQLTQVYSQQAELEKNIDVTEQAVRKAANKHRELQKAKFSKLQPPAPELEMKQEATH